MKSPKSLSLASGEKYRIGDLEVSSQRSIVGDSDVWYFQEERGDNFPEGRIAFKIWGKEQTIRFLTLIKAKKVKR